jgi:hypothetical protein
MDTFQKIDTKIQEGYEYLFKNNSVKCCDAWLEAWEGIRELLISGLAVDIFDMDKKYRWSELVSNCVQDLEMELHNAGLKDVAYHGKRIDYCRELLSWCGSEDDLMIGNTRRAIAEGYFWSGDEAECDRLFAGWLHDDPDWGWGYIGRSDCYQYKDNDEGYAKAEEILLAAYARDGLRDKIEVIERIISLYSDMGKTDKVKEFKKEFTILQPAQPKGSYYYKPSPAVKSEKIGRNEPCPCGSGKKYKKCCGA